MLAIHIASCSGFQCGGVSGDCISQNKVCDGKQDCKTGEDEQPGICGKCNIEYFCFILAVGIISHMENNVPLSCVTCIYLGDVL